MPTIADRRRSRSIGHFIDRVTEQNMFRSTLGQLAGLRARSDEQLTDEELSYAQIFLVAAEGGMGKTTLLRRFEAIAAENKAGAGAKALYADFERHSTISDPDKLMRVLHDALCEAGFEPEMKPYRDEVAKRSEVQRKAVDAEEKYKTMMASLGGKGVQIATSGVMDKEIAAEGIRLLVGGAESLRGFIAKKLDPDELKLYDDPDALTETFMSALNNIATPKRPLALLLDTYELADHCDNWLRKRALPQSNPRLIWVIAGREGQPFIRRYEDEFGASLLGRILLDTFARPDIVDYIKESGIGAPTDELVDRLQALSRGIPLALEGYVNLLQKNVALPPPDPTAPTTRREIVNKMTDRFLRYCNEDDQHLPLEQRRERTAIRNNILTLMLLRHTEIEALAAAWQCSLEQAEATVNDLAEQFSFIFAQEIERQPQGLVKEFLREYLRGLATLPVTIQNGVERLVAHLDGQMRDREKELSPNGLRRPLWQDAKWREALLDNINALCWTERSGERVMKLLVPMFVEALEFDPDIAAALLTTAEEFAEAWPEGHRQLFKKLAAGRSGPQHWDSAKQSELQTILGAMQLDSVYRRLSAFQRAILHLQRSRLLLRAGYDATSENSDLTMAAAKEIARLLHTGGGELKEPLAYLYRDLANVYIELKQYNQAIEAYQKAIELDPTSAYPHYGLGGVYYYLNQYDQAVKACHKAIELDPTSAYPHYNLGSVYSGLQQYQQAIEAYNRAIELDPTFAAAHYNLGSVYSDLQQYQQAIEAYNRAIELDPTLAYPRYGLGQIYDLLGWQDQARAAYQRALEIDPQHYPSIFSLARIERQTGNQVQAVALVDRARPLLPPDDFYNLACLESIAGNADAAVEALRVALERGQASLEWAREDPDLVFVRDDPRYRTVVGLNNSEC